MKSASQRARCWSPWNTKSTAGQAEDFLAALQKYSRVRRRDGAYRWGIYRDTERATHYVETFIVESWAEHLRQHGRVTIADRAIEENVDRFDANPKVTHFIYAQSKPKTQSAPR